MTNFRASVVVDALVSGLVKGSLGSDGLGIDGLVNSGLVKNAIAANRRQWVPRTVSVIIKLCVASIVLSSVVSCGGGRDTAGASVTDRPQPLTQGLSPTGQVDSAQTRFSWPALENASQYQLVVEDEYGNHYQQSVTAQAAGCSDESSDCSAMPEISYYNQTLSWRVDAIVDGVVVPLTHPLKFVTPLNTAVHPATDNASVCDVWPTLVYDRFAVLNNIWNAGTVRSDDWQQTIAAKQSADNAIVASWTYDWLSQSQGVPQAVKAYPEVIYGNKLGTLITGDKALIGLPERIDKLENFTIDFRYSETGNAERNVAIESFFHDSCEITGPCHLDDNRAYEMMVWINNPTTWRPGDLAERAVEIDGLLWDVYIKPRSNKSYIAFAANTPQTEGTINWNRFVEWTVDWTTQNAAELRISAMTADLCMGAIEFGTELWSGAGTFTLEQFEVSRNQVKK